MHLFFDTETTGLANTRLEPSRDPVRICQFAAIMCDENRKIVGQFKALVKPEGWVVDPDTAKFHGLTTELCEAYGIGMAGILVLFDRWCQMSDVLIAFNNAYDLHMLEVECHHHARAVRLPPRGDCALQMATPILKLPATDNMIRSGRGDQFKWPSLKETHKAFFGEDFDGAHDALADVKATMRSYFYMLDLASRSAAA